MTVGGATVYQRLRRDVLAQLDAERVDPTSQPERVRQVVGGLVADYQRGAAVWTEPRLRDAAEMARRLEASVVAFGPLTDVLTSPEVEEVFIEGARVTWMDRTGRLHGLAEPTSEEENRAVVDRLLAPTTRSLDTRSPMVQARVLEGRARLSAAIPPVAEALSATIRRHATRRHDLDGLVASGSLSTGAASLLRLVMAGWSSVVVSGQPGAGKTSLLAALLGAVPPQRCVRVCEEIRELTVPLTHGSYYEARPPSVSGEAEVSLRDLLKFCLGMRSDLIVVGEVRGAEAFELTRAVNAGCGFACTVHANSARDAMDALVNAAIMAGEHVPEALVRKVFCGAVDLVAHVDVHDSAGGSVGATGPAGADAGSRREVREIVAVMPPVADTVATEPIFTRPDGPGTPLRWTGIVPPSLERLERHLPAGQSLRDLLAA